MEDNRRPWPEANEDSREFWEGIKAHRIMAQKCSQCGALRFYPKHLCPHCLSDQFEWSLCSGRGQIYSYTNIYRAPLKAFADQVPYTIGLIDLEEGIRIMGRVKGNPDSMAIGKEVRAIFEDISAGISLPMFELTR
jgi:uncharacterized OB-fold protein